MTKKLPFFPLYTSDFVADTQDLTNEEIGAYFRILMYSWGKGKFKLDRIQWICQDDEIWSALEQYFEEENGLWYNPRMERERLKAKSRHDKAVKANTARWDATSNAPSNAPSNPQGHPPVIQTHNSEPITYNTESKIQKKRTPAVNVYRDIQGLILTKEEYAKLIERYEKPLVADVLDAMENYKGLNKKYVSAYKTALNWIARRAEKTIQPVDRPMRSRPE